MAKRIKSEKEIENKILDFMNRIDGCFAWKVNSVGVYDPVKKVYRLPKSKHILSGVSDIIGVYNGRFIAIEVKKKTGKVSEEQYLFIDNIIKNGGCAGVARSLADAIKLLKAWGTYEIKSISE